MTQTLLFIDGGSSGDSTSATELCGKMCSVRSCKCFSKIIFSKACYLDAYVSARFEKISHVFFFENSFRNMDYRLMRWKRVEDQRKDFSAYIL